jgi:hypothetical protein
MNSQVLPKESMLFMSMSLRLGPTVARLEATGIQKTTTMVETWMLSAILVIWATSLLTPDGNATGSLLAFVPLEGTKGIKNRSVVVHALEDDLGLGGDTGSRAVGNAGARPACGTIKEV